MKKVTAYILALLMILSLTGGFTAMAEEEPVTLSIFIDESWWPLSEWKGKIPEMVTAATGVTLDVTVAVDENQLPLMVASGDLPDMICSYQYSRLSDDSICYSYNELIEQYEPDWVVDPATAYVNSVVGSGGKFYVIKNDFASPAQWEASPLSVHQGCGISFRQDILDDLGITVDDIDSLEKMEEVFDMVLEKYNGEITPLVTGTQNFGWFKIQKYVRSDDWYEDADGNASFFIDDPNLYEWFKLLNKWYRAGYWKAEDVATENYEDLILNGKVFCYTAYDNSADTINATLKNAGLDYYYKAKVDWVTEEACLVDYRIGWRGLFITRNCSDPEAAIRFARFCYSPEGQRLLLWGEEGVDWEYTEEGYPTYLTWGPTDEAKISELGVRYWGWMTCDNIINGLGYGVGYEQTMEVKRYITDHTDRRVYLGMLNPPVDSNEAGIADRLKELYNSNWLKIASAESEEQMDEFYQVYLDQAEAIGLPELEAWANTIYPEIKAGYAAATGETLS